MTSVLGELGFGVSTCRNKGTQSDLRTRFCLYARMGGTGQAHNQGGGQLPSTVTKVAPKKFRLIIFMYKPKKYFGANQHKCLRNLSCFSF